MDGGKQENERDERRTKSDGNNAQDRTKWKKTAKTASGTNTVCNVTQGGPRRDKSVACTKQRGTNRDRTKDGRRR